MRQKAVIGAMLLVAANTACSTSPQSSSLRADGDVVTIDVVDNRRADVFALLASLDAARAGTGNLQLTDLARVVAVVPADAGVFAAAYPDAFTVGCDGAICTGTGRGAAAKAAVVAESPDLRGVSMGVRTSLSSSWRILSPGASAIVCDVEGVYFSRLFVRKNLKAFKIELTPEGGTVTVWLAGASDVPACEETP